MVGKLNRFFEVRKDYGALFIRLAIGLRLIDGTLDNIVSWDRMNEFADFLHGYSFPLPLLSAVVSVYAQFTCGILYIAGAYIRVAALVMIVNFIVALLLVHLPLTFDESFDALMMLFGSLFFLFHGAGKVSLDFRLKK